jgi:hypothetical protein
LCCGGFHVRANLGPRRDQDARAGGGDKGGFLAGQVFKLTGFVADEGSVVKAADDHAVSVTCRRSFEEHAEA